jgi:hypothetical protein
MDAGDRRPSVMSVVNKDVGDLISDAFQRGKPSSFDYRNLCVVSANPKFGSSGIGSVNISVANGSGKPLTKHTVEVETTNGTKALSTSNVVTAQEKVRGAILGEEFSELVGLNPNTDWDKYNFPESEEFVGTEAQSHLNELDAFIMNSLPKHLVGRFFSGERDPASTGKCPSLDRTLVKSPEAIEKRGLIFNNIVDCYGEDLDPKIIVAITKRNAAFKNL